MSTDLTTRPAASGQLAHLDQQKVDLIRRTIAAKATDDELELFVGLANRTGLDPFTRQIFLVPRKQKIDDAWVETHQAMVSIDGARLVAQRSGAYRGQTAPEWCGPDGVWHEAWLDQVEPPAAARVGVFHADYPDRPTYGVARYRSYVQTVGRDGAPNQTWHRMPDVMLAKCAEMLALRKAFQQDLSGLIIEEEAGNDPVILDPEITKPSGESMPRRKASRDEEKLVSDARKAKGITTAEFNAILDEHGEGATTAPWSDQVRAILDAIERHGMDDVAAVTGEPPASAAAGGEEEQAERVDDAELFNPDEAA